MSALHVGSVDVGALVGLVLVIGAMGGICWLHAYAVDRGWL
jgi:hypothetical protein